MGIGIILLVLSIIVPSGDMGNIFSWILFLLLTPIVILSRFINLEHIGFGPFPAFTVLLLPYLFIIGAIIGFIIGKIRRAK